MARLYNAIRMVRNYDGRGSALGDIGVNAIAPNPDALSSFAAIRSSDQALTVMIINKALNGTTTAAVRVTNFSGAAAAQRWELTSENVIRQVDDLAVTGGTMNIDIPPQSITLLVIPTDAPRRRRAVH